MSVMLHLVVRIGVIFLGLSFHKEADGKREDILTHNSSLAGSSNSYLIKIGKRNLRSVDNSGAKVSLVHRRVYQSLKDAPRLINKTLICG